MTIANRKSHIAKIGQFGRFHLTWNAKKAGDIQECVVSETELW